ncbi:MAG: 5-formyltetrahydrofolate cyclo-ligase [Aigarchaeota archaeon]|nr:5-formyltetrahydrofolate cyclo-ligase [Aigarchaeota archaeon]MDW8093225.1 5-formyltetrahydrofolate cyclo-ligase [Nitrososphaerota archaeon]
MNRGKQEIRLMVWDRLVKEGVALPPFPVKGRIPNFKGADTAAERLFDSSIYKRARVVKVNPDSPQRCIRDRVLGDGKVLVVPTPRLRRGFLMLEPDMIRGEGVELRLAIKNFMRLGVEVAPEDLPEIDLLVFGSVAVTEDGWRLGKGEGYSEIEYAILSEFRRVDGNVPIVTTVHDLQLVDFIPREAYDVPLNYIFTNTRVIEVRANNKRPQGILWDSLDEGKIKEIPLLRDMRGSLRR